MASVGPDSQVDANGVARRDLIEGAVMLAGVSATPAVTAPVGQSANRQAAYAALSRCETPLLA